MSSEENSPVEVAINGFGRIGRSVLRAILNSERSLSRIKIVAVNVGPDNLEDCQYWIKYDSTMGKIDSSIELKQNGAELLIRKSGVENRINLIAEPDVGKIDWKKYSKKLVVVESSGRNSSREQAQLHLTEAGAEKVVITAPSLDADKMLIIGVNDNCYDRSKDNIISLGSCTTNCAAAVIKSLSSRYDILDISLTTIHAYTNGQRLLDSSHRKDKRRGRAAAENIIPTTTGAQKALGKIFENRFPIYAHSIRVPVKNVSLCQITVRITDRSPFPNSTEELNKLFIESEKQELLGILGTTAEPLVSSDFIGTQESATVDLSLTQLSEDKKSFTIFAWYDNEYGYSCRVREFLEMIF
jgi:glyceraldehyde 3-phosphate dehydrogenase